jgi:hypothetical protein
MTDNLFFSFDKYAEAVAETVIDWSKDGTLVLSINGPWGCGKTTLMNLAVEKLDDKKYIKTTFNAWRFNKEDALWRGFFVSVISALREHLVKLKNNNSIAWDANDFELCHELLDETEKSLYSAFTKEIPGEISIDTGNLAKSGLKLALKFVPWGGFGADWIDRIFQKKDKSGKPSVDTFNEKDIDNLWGIFKRSVVKRQIEKLASMEQFRFSVETVTRAILYGVYEEPQTQKRIKIIPNPFKLVVAIDDLDRCLPEQALEIFEAIKLFLDLPGTTFLVALDHDIIQHALNLRYKQDNLKRPQIKAKQYTEKMIDLSFQVPSVLDSNFLNYIKQELPNGRSLSSLYQTLKIALPLNIRTWERFSVKADFNMKIIKSITEDRKIKEIKVESIFENQQLSALYFKLQCLAYQWPDIFRRIGNIDVYSELERCILESTRSHFEEEQNEDLAALIIKSSSDTDKVPNSVWNSIKDLNLIQYLKAEPHVKSIENRLPLNIVFSMDHRQ